jgi:hypothetical protein
MQQSARWILLTVGIAAAVLTGNAVSKHIPAAAAEKGEAVEMRLQRLEDREEIRQLLIDYGRFLDRGDFTAFSQLFSEKEGEWIGGMGQAKSSQAIRKLMEDTIGKGISKSGPPSCHVFSNETINVNGDRAQATAKWMFLVQGDSGRPQAFYLGHYEDSLVRESGRWKFLRRVVYSDIPKDDPTRNKKQKAPVD